MYDSTNILCMVYLDVVIFMCNLLKVVMGDLSVEERIRLIGHIQAEVSPTKAAKTFKCEYSTPVYKILIKKQATK